ncbi:MAG: hypothetical protein HQM03_08285 [Magnetococcales bacterium]|nr:hypothetical protein [Magnetococcales bacterium]
MKTFAEYLILAGFLLVVAALVHGMGMLIWPGFLLLLCGVILLLLARSDLFRGPMAHGPWQ